MLSMRHDEKLVVNVFAAKPEKKMKTVWDSLSGFISSDSAVSSRIEEDSSALLALDATSTNLNFLDYQYRPKIMSTLSVDDVASKIESIVAEALKNGDVKVYGPAYFGKKITHPDHLVVHNAILSLVKGNKFPNVKWYMYEDMPYTISYLKGKRQPLADFLASSSPDFTFTEKNTFLTDKALQTKGISLDSYHSQFKAFKKSGYKLDDILNFAKANCTHAPCEKVFEVKFK
jgi:LmbE family N-acetylglucosaminyl deacetylase